MPQQYSAPYGDIFFVDTPNIDKTAQQLYAQENQRRLLRQKQIADLDDHFSKNVANIRDADVDEYTAAYQDWKNAKIGLMKNKHLQGNDYAQAQLEVNRKLADVMKLANLSKSWKGTEEDLAKRMMMKPDDYNDDAWDYIKQSRTLPLGKLTAYQKMGQDGKPGAVDLTNVENYLYRDDTNWQPILQKAAGTAITRGNPLEEETPDKLQRKMTSYKASNDPITFYNGVVSSFSKPRSSEDFAKRFQFSPEEAQSITEQFEAYKQTPEFKAAYGDVKFPESTNLTNGTRTAKLIAMQHALQNPVTAVVSYKPNQDQITKRREDFTKSMTEQRHQNSIKRLYIYAGLQANKPMSPKEIELGIDGLIASHIKSAQQNNGELNVDAETYKAITGQDQTPLSYLTVDAEGNFKYGKKNSTTNTVDEKTIKNIPYQLVKAKLTEAYPKTTPVVNQPNVQKPSGSNPKKVKLTW